MDTLEIDKSNIKTTWKYDLQSIIRFSEVSE